MSRHTAGPWFVREIDLLEGGKGVEVVAGDGEVICDNQTYYPQALDPRNASLIAAAPKLLKALEGIMRVEARDRIMPVGAEWDAARAVIAEVTGEGQ